MLAEAVPALKKLSIVLASGSPRRKDILKLTGLDFSIIPSTFPEDLDKSLYVNRPDAYVVDNARYKALDVANTHSGDLIIGCDTVVTLDGEIIEKPKNSSHALEMLQRLNGRDHIVYSGVVLVQNLPERKIHQLHEKSLVKFGKVSNSLLQSYVNTREPLDKAGGYGIQGQGAILIEKVDGDYYNVMGLPLYRLSCELQKIYS